MSETPLVWEVMFAVWTGAAAWMDLRSRRVWWAWFIIGFLAAGAFRVWAWFTYGFAFDQLLLITAITMAAFQLWRAGFWGGADAKTAIVLILALPDWRMVLLLALVDLVVIVVWIVARNGWAGLQEFSRRTRGVLRGDEPEGSETIPLVAVMVLGYWISILML